MNHIKELRKQKKMTLDQLSSDLQINRATLNRYENEKSEPKLETWVKLADYFGVSVPYLQGLADSPQGFVYQAPTNEEVWQFHEAHTLEEISDADTDAAYTELIALVKTLTNKNVQNNKLTDDELAQLSVTAEKAVLAGRAFRREQIEAMLEQQPRSNDIKKDATQTDDAK